MPYPYLEFGKGFPVVMLHAFPLSGNMWTGNARSISENGFRAIIPDLPGFGENTQADSGFTIDDMADGVLQLLDHLRIEKSVLMGLSMGGYVLFSLLRMIPERVSALILCDTTCKSDDEEKRKSRRSLLNRLQREGSAVLAREMLPNLLSPHTIRSQPDLLDKLTRQIYICDKDSACDALHAMAERRDQCDLLQKITVPTLLIFGSDDAITNIQGAQEMSSLIFGSRLVLIEGAGHYSNLESPADFNLHLNSFLISLKLNH